jgi:GTPase SAR1 family protein
MLNPEIEEGNIEYKRLISCNKNRHITLASQMKWRLNEGNGICYYFIGVEDNGSISNRKKKELYNSLKNLKLVTKLINAKIIDVKKNTFKNKDYLKVTISYIFNTKIPEVRILLLGSTKSGKTTFISKLKKIKDEKVGRQSIYIHKHEILNDKTSSLTICTFGLDKNNNILDSYEFSGKKNLNKCKKIITIIDTPGDKEYYKTLLYSISSTNPHKVIIFDKNYEYINILKELKIDYHILENNKYEDFVKQIKNTKALKSNLRYSKIISLKKIPLLGYLCFIINLTKSVIRPQKNYYLYDGITTTKIFINTIHYNEIPVDKLHPNQLGTMHITSEIDMTKFIKNKNLILLEKNDTKNFVMQKYIKNKSIVYKNFLLKNKDLKIPKLSYSFTFCL